MMTAGRHRGPGGGAGSGRGVGGVRSTGLLLAPSTIHFLSDHGTDIMSHVLSTDLERNITDISRKIVENGDYPKIQVVEKDGNWFTLNNSQLELCRRLEREGCCQRVKVDVVSITEVPIQLRGMMVLPRPDGPPPLGLRDGPAGAGDVVGRPPADRAAEPGLSSSKPAKAAAAADHNQQQQLKPSSTGEAASDASRSTGKGYQKLETAEPSEKGAENKKPASGEKAEVTDTSDDSDTEDEDSDSECDWSQDEADSSDGNTTDDDRSTDDERECLL